MHAQPVIFSRDDLDLIVAFAGCSLDEKPGKNWVENVGGLPEYICQIARAIKRSGKTTSQAIAIAVSRVKKWAAGGDDVDADTRAKAAKALAQWEAKKARSKAKSVKASRVDTEVLCLAKVDYNVDTVRSAFDTRQREARKSWRDANPNSYDYPDHLYVKELWTSFIIAASGYGDGKKLFKIPYTVQKDQNVDFGEPAEVRTQYVVVDNDELGDGNLSDADLKKMMDLSAPARPGALDRILALGD